MEELNPPHFVCSHRGFPSGSVLNNPPANAGDVGSIPGLGRSLEKEMATYSSILAWQIPWTEEPGLCYSPWGLKESGMTSRLNGDQQLAS